MISKKHGCFLALTLLLASNCLASEPGQSREMQHLWVDDGYQIAVDSDPPWKWGLDHSGKEPVFIIETPDLYYPPAVVNVRYKRGIKIDANELYFKRVAESAINEAAINYGAIDTNRYPIIRATYGELSGYERMFAGKVNGKERQVKVYVCRNKSNEILVLTVLTLPNKITDIQPAVTRIWENITFLN